MDQPQTLLGQRIQPRPELLVIEAGTAVQQHQRMAASQLDDVQHAAVIQFHQPLISH